MAVFLDDNEASHLRQVVRDLTADRDKWKRESELAHAAAHRLRIENDELKRRLHEKGS